MEHNLVSPSSMDATPLDTPPSPSPPAPSILATGTDRDTNDYLSSDDENEEMPSAPPDPLFEEEADEEDEAWVMRNLRGGALSDVKINATAATAPATPATTKLLESRTTDAVLNCPCCFNTVCMDCQAHTRYKSQWRAMFVMAVYVDWNKHMRYDEDAKDLVEIGPGTTGEQYHPVHCANCQTKVAVLNMEDEVYHFYNAIESR